MTLEVQHHTLESTDGTRIAWQSVGSDPSATTAIVIVNGPGADLYAWRGFVEEFAPHLRIIAWDYRGFFRSGPPRRPGPIRVEHHCDDLREVLDAAGIERAVFVSWSLGTQVALEFYRTDPERFAGIVSVNGTYGTPFRTSRAVPGQSLLGLARSFGPGSGRLMRTMVNALRVPALFRLTQRVGLVSATAGQDEFVRIADAFAVQDPALYARLIDGFSDHDAEDVLTTIRCPALFFAGRRDPLVPSTYSLYMAAKVRSADLLVIPIASHYIPIEFAEYLNLRVEAFLAERLPDVWCP